ncbi:MAG: hypothetical protein V7645_2141 [Actinomycetota bacterium]
MTVDATSPASSGPAGSHFEGQVGAHYLLSMLTGAEPRGLPGITIDRIELQRGAEGSPLDDVVLRGHNSRGEPAILEIQVKRSISFAPSDPVFRSVVAQIANASRKPEFWSSRYELAIATARTSRKIDGAYQDVLTWARQLDSAATFMARIGRPGSANDDMRRFVDTFRSHLRDVGAGDDDETVWQLLRRLQILVFDFTSQGSASEELARERAVHALHPDEKARAASLWASLVELALAVAASGGDRTRDRVIEDLSHQFYRLSGERRHYSVRTALAEAAKNALADIGDRVGNVTITRPVPATAVHSALDEGRYVEIRGDAGVGKSAVLKHFAEQLSAESRVLVLSPGRTTRRGWMAMRGELGFEGTARELLSDLASDGGGALFIDGLDLFDEEERKTVVDIVGEAANVSGFVIIATMRRNFGVEEPNWLPADALDRLGRAPPVVIDELSAAEIDELRNAAPGLAALLADSHPARAVARNLFRLSRLAARPSDEPAPRTEIDMAEQWWRSADGRYDDDHRERARLLRAVAEKSLLSTEPFDASQQPPRAVDALVRSETLRDLGGDRVAFRHDVLREWAIASLLYVEPDAIDRLPLDRPASAALARGIELTARMILERAADGNRWNLLLGRLSRQGAHASWRRAALLALVHSETSSELLERVSDLLTADRGSLLRELIRIVMAVDVEPASELFKAAGIDAAAIPRGLHIPNGPSWGRLILWLLRQREQLAPAVIPDIVDLYTAWSLGMIGLDTVTPLLLRWLHHWLTEIEDAREAGPRWHEPFNGELERQQLRSLESDLRTGFLLFCRRTPALAADYLRSVERRGYRDDVVQSILKFRGSLAEAAPAELAKLTERALIPEPDSSRSRGHRELEEPFTYVDHEFTPASPAQGPFLELLTHAPEQGLSLIRRLVDHQISFHTGGRDHGSNALIIPFPDGERAFPWVRSYAWSREGGSHSFCVTSALMALEAWAHRRIEAGEPVDKAISDVLGPLGAPAAYLLVAVDLLLSHWPTSRQPAVPFLGCPELLCLDRERQVHDGIEYPDLFGLKDLQKEPVGAASLASLAQRPSRRFCIEQLIRYYAIAEEPEPRNTLTDLLRRAAARLGPPDERSDLGDPALMVVHALNLVDPRNWHKATVKRTDGTEILGRQYVSPKAEKRRLECLQEESQDRFTNSNMQTILALALDPVRSSFELAAAVVNWAHRVTATAKDGGTDEDPIREDGGADEDPIDEDGGAHEERMREEAVITAAMIAMRDGDGDLRARQRDWARSVFVQALQTKDDPSHRVRPGLRFNPIAIAFAGMVYLLKDNPSPTDVRALLDVAASSNPASAHGFGAAAGALATIDERLVRSVLRCALAARVRPVRSSELSEEQTAAREERCRRRVEGAVDAEMVWLRGERPEPTWPDWPSEGVVPRQRRRLRLPGGTSPEQPPVRRPQVLEERVDHQGAALWLRNVARLVDITKRPWLREIVRTYAVWTAITNGAELDSTEEVSQEPGEWNNAYFDLLTRCLPGLESPDVDELVLTKILSLPEKSFFDVVTVFLRSVDAVYFGNQDIEVADAVRIRSTLADRLITSSGWRWMNASSSASVEMHLGPAIAVFFFNDYGHFQPAKSYLLPPAIDRLDPFLPVLRKLIESGPSLFVALVMLNLLEVSPRAAHLPFAVSAAKTWLSSHPDDAEFWVEYAIGPRVCALIDAAWRQEPALLRRDQTRRGDVDTLLAVLIRLGVAEAKRLEDALADDV